MKAADAIGVAGQLRRKDLDGHGPLERLVIGPINVAQRVAADPLDDAVGAEARHGTSSAFRGEFSPARPAARRRQPRRAVLFRFARQVGHSVQGLPGVEAARLLGLFEFGSVDVQQHDIPIAGNGDPIVFSGGAKQEAAVDLKSRREVAVSFLIPVRRCRRRRIASRETAAFRRRKRRRLFPHNRRRWAIRAELARADRPAVQAELGIAHHDPSVRVDVQKLAESLGHRFRLHMPRQSRFPRFGKIVNGNRFVRVPPRTVLTDNAQPPFRGPGATRDLPAGRVARNRGVEGRERSKTEISPSLIRYTYPL